MPLFRDLSTSEQLTVGQEVIRRESFVRAALIDVVRRSVTYLTILLMASGITVLGAGMRFEYHSALFVMAVICFLLGLLCVGIMFAINHRLLFGLMTGFEWFKFRILDSQIDTSLLNSPPPLNVPRAGRIAVGSGYAAFILWVLGATLGVTAFTVGIPAKTVSLTRQSTESADAQRGAPTATNPLPATQRGTPHAIQPGLTVGDKIAIGALVVGLAQAVALTWTVWLASRTARRQLRAYVVPDTYDLISGTAVNPPIPAQVDVPFCVLICKNTGQTPAYNVRIYAQLSVIEPKNESTLIVPPLQAGMYSVLGPNVGMRSPRSLNRNLTAGEIADIQTGMKAIYLFGRIEYRDAFKKNRFTTFRMMYSGVWPLTAPAGLNFAVQGNEAD